MMKHAFPLVLVTLALTACGSRDSGAIESGEGNAASQVSSPTPSVTPSTVRNIAVEEWIRAKYPDMGPLMYKWAPVDLDGDGIDEYLVYLGGPTICGSGGCPLDVLKREKEAFTVITETSVTQLPVGVLDTSTNGWKDLWVTIYGGGAEAQSRKLSFDGTTYPSNPTVAPSTELAAPGNALIEDGPLTPLP